ncbi:MAG: hypothetical protein AAGJ46_20825 [Planctomycetota bacterium]
MKLQILNSSGRIGVAMCFTSLLSPCLTAEELQHRSRPTAALLERQLPIGHLGEPLGVLVEVQGFYEVKLDPPGRVSKISPPTMLHIETVNGRKLRNATAFTFAKDSLYRAVKPSDGEKFRLLGYETGFFTGLVEGTADLEVVAARPARGDFRYQRRFVVMKDVLKNISERDAIRLR